MDAKITLSFNETVIASAKEFAKENNLSLSRLTEFLLQRVVDSSGYSLDELPVSDWVNMVSEGKVKYQRKPRSNKKLKEEYYSRKKKS